MPGSPFNSDKLSAAQKATLARAYGLDKPVLVRFFLYLKNMLKGDFGVSYNLSINTPVLTMIKSRLPISMRIGVCSLLLGSVFGLAIGFLAAFHQGKAAHLRRLRQLPPAPLQAVALHGDPRAAHDRMQPRRGRASRGVRYEKCEVKRDRALFELNRALSPDY